jgi:hypothetical protein
MMVEAEPERGQTQIDQVYSVCFFGKGWPVPEVQFLEAATDKDASALAGSMKPWMTREVWQRHRLVRVLPPTLINGSRT